MDPDARFWKGQRILVVSPHPDDEVFGCGGTMAKAKALGAEVYLMIFSVGDLKFFEKKEIVTAKERLQEVKKVATILDLDGYDVLYTDAQTHLRLDAIPRRDLISQVETRSKVSMQKIQPTIIAIPAPSYNQDHEAVFEACLAATRIHAGGIKANPSTVLIYDSPTLSWNQAGREFHPNFYVDIADHLKTKLKLIQAYRSQARHENDPTSLKSLEDLAHVRGREVGRDACEAYMTARFVV
jgi:N-acetylglucosamine malate deacetylase 1